MGLKFSTTVKFALPQKQKKPTDKHEENIFEQYLNKITSKICILIFNSMVIQALGVLWNYLIPDRYNSVHILD